MPRTLAADVALGAASGAAATLAMSVVMLGAQRAGAFRRQPPEEITRDALRAVDVEPTEAELDVAAGVAHVGFGAALGTAFALLHRWIPGVRVIPELAAAAFAVGVWAVSYAGWVPALGIMPPPQRDEPGRPATMIAAHVVFGAALGALHRRLRR